MSTSDGDYKDSEMHAELNSSGCNGSTRVEVCTIFASALSKCIIVVFQRLW